MTVAVGSAMIVILVGWRLHRAPPPRAAALRRCTVHRRRIVVAVIAAAAAAALGPVAGLATLLGSDVARRMAAVRRAARATRQIAADYPDTLDLMVLSIRAGYLPAQAVIEVARFLPPTLRASFGRVDQAMQSGARFADALQQLCAHLGPIAQPLVDSLSSADRYGLPIAPVLERLAFEARQQRRRDADAAARELPVRLAVPLVVCTLPSFVLLAIVPLLLGALSSLHT
ncbi:MAG: type II secretion system F family protein [Ilumatobacteraceae bacterium]